MHGLRITQRPTPAQSRAGAKVAIRVHFGAGRAVPAFVGLHRTQINELIKRGEFPRPISLSDSGRAIAWLEADLIAWQATRLARREEPVSKAKGRAR